MEELCFGYANDIEVPEIVIIVMLIGLFITPFVTNEKEDIKFEDLPDAWKCPICGVGKDKFIKI